MINWINNLKVFIANLRLTGFDTTVWNLCLILAGICLFFASRYLIAFFVHRLKSYRKEVIASFLQSVSLQISVVFALIPIIHAAKGIAHDMNMDGFINPNEIFPILITAVMAWAMIAIVGCIGEFYLAEVRAGRVAANKIVIVLVTKFSRIIVIITMAVPLAGKLGIDLRGLLALSGVGGAILALGAKDIAGSYLSGVFIVLDKSFNVGDWICAHDGKIEGIIEHIGWQRIHIRKFDTTLLSVPNSHLASMPVQNVSAMSNRRMFDEFKFEYPDVSKIPTVINSIKNMLEIDNNIDHTKLLVVMLMDIGKGIATYKIYCLFRETGFKKFYEIRNDIVVRIAQICIENECHMASAGAQEQMYYQMIDEDDLIASMNTKKCE